MILLAHRWLETRERGRLAVRRAGAPRGSGHLLLGLLTALAFCLAGSPATGTDYCIDTANGSDTNSGLCPNEAWATFEPSWLYPFQYGDVVRIAPGRYSYPFTAWYMLPGISWIGSGAAETEVVYTKFVAVPFVRFRTSSDGSGPPADLRPEAFGTDTVLSDLTLVNQGQATSGVDVRVSSATSGPTIRNLEIVGFPTGIELHPSSDERAEATTQAVLTQNVIRGATDSGVVFYADVFYDKLVTEASTMTNSLVRSSGVGANVRTFISYTNNYDPTSAVSEPVLTNNTITGGTESSALLISYLDDGTGKWASQEDAGTLNPVFRNNIFTASDRYGIEEHSPFTEPLETTRNALGGNSLGDYLDEGSVPAAAPSVGTGNISAVPLFVDLPGGDLHVLGSSPTLDLVPAATAPAVDVDGQSRPEGADADMGADEFLDCLLVADASNSTTPPPCTGGSVTLDGSATTVDTSVCSAGLLYAWYDDNGLIGTGVTLPYSPAQESQVTLQVRCDDPALTACRDSTQITVFPPTPAVIADAGPDLVLAVGESAPLGGMPTGSAGTPPLQFAWDPDPPELGTGADPENPVYTPAAPGSPVFTVTVTDEAGCTSQDSVTVTVVAALAADAGPDQAIPFAGQAQLGGAPAASGGEPAYAYSWSPTDGLDDPASPNPSFTAPGSGPWAFILTVTDSRNREATDSVTITVSPPLVADAGNDRTIQDTGTTVLGGNPAASGGLGPYQYAWSPPQDLDRTDIANPTFTPPGTGPFNYTLTVTDAQSVIAQDDVLITVTTLPPLVVDAGADRTIDIQEVTQLGGSPTAEGGAPPYSYAWSPIDGLDDASAPNPQFTPSSGGEFVFTVDVQDDEGNVSQDSVTVTAPDPLLADAGPDQSIDISETAGLGGAPAASGGTLPYVYSWSPTDGLDDPSAPNPTFTPDTEGEFTFTLTVSDDRSEIAVDQTTITVTRVVPLVVEAGQDRLIETGESTVLGGGPTASGGTPGYVYEWTPSNPDLNDTTAANPRFTPLSPGVYDFTLRVIDAADQESTDTVRVEVEDPPPGSPPAEVPELTVSRNCSEQGFLSIRFTGAARAEFHRLYVGTLGDYPNHSNPALPEGCDWPSPPEDPDIPFLFRNQQGCGPGSFYYLVVGVNTAGEGPYGQEDPDGNPQTGGPERPPGTNPSCP